MNTSKPKLLFVYDHPTPSRWMDGLWAALKLLEKDFDITWFNLAEKETFVPGDRQYDFTLGWGGFRSRVDWNLKKHLKNTANKRGLCIAGNAFAPEDTNNYDVLFYETKWYRPQIEFHPNIIQAFGINTDIFAPIDIATPVVWDYLGVGALADWKRWELMSNKSGNRLVVGEYQLGNEQESGRIAKELIKAGVMVSGMVHPFDLANLYHWSRKLYIPASVNGGGERAILEARSCGLEVEIEPDNPKLAELLTCPISTHFEYAEKLRKGILSCLT